LAFACLANAAEEPPAQYEFAYAVNEPATGDQKDQHETRNGDQVDGYYRTLDADGYVRTVKYKSDAVNGFTAEVIRQPASGGATTVPVPARAVPVKVAPAVPLPSYVPSASYYYEPSVYSYGYQPSYSYGSYQPYFYGYQPSYRYGYQPYTYSPYAYGQFGGQYVSPALVRK